jgi:hypothetical protein
MPTLPDPFATSPISLRCPLCHAVAWQLCQVVAGDLELFHMERIAAAAAKAVELRHRAAKSRLSRFAQTVPGKPEYLG